MAIAMAVRAVTTVTVRVTAIALTALLLLLSFCLSMETRIGLSIFQHFSFPSDVFAPAQSIMHVITPCDYYMVDTTAKHSLGECV